MHPLPFTVTEREAMEALVAIVEQMPRARIVTRTRDYLHAEFTSRVFRFVDDVEILIDGKARLVHFRSASRAGYSDLGANRERMKTIAELASSALQNEEPGGEASSSSSPAGLDGPASARAGG